MLFITNRIITQSPRSRAGRNITFDLSVADAAQSLFFCERTGKDKYEEVLSGPFFERLKKKNIEHIVIYLHGFNNTPEDVFAKTASLSKDFGKTVAVVPIVWPCRKGSDDNILSEYYDDQHAADATGLALARALGKFWTWQQEEDPCQKRINVLAHSMGNRILRRAMSYWATNILHHAPPYIFRNCFMAAADVANEALDVGSEGEAISFASRNVVVYYSANDLALRASKIANASEVSRRLGHTGPYDSEVTPTNVFSFDCSDIPTPNDRNGHSYIYEKPLTKHMLAMIKSGRVTESDTETREWVLEAS